MKKNKFAKSISHSEPGPGDAGQTGSWRVERPVLDPGRCLPVKKHKETCFFCWMYCPDGVISRTIPPQFDYQYCKGCGICAEECPAGAITMINETETESS